MSFNNDYEFYKNFNSIDNKNINTIFNNLGLTFDKSKIITFPKLDSDLGSIPDRVNRMLQAFRFVMYDCIQDSDKASNFSSLFSSLIHDAITSETSVFYTRSDDLCKGRPIPYNIEIFVKGGYYVGPDEYYGKKCITENSLNLCAGFLVYDRDYHGYDFVVMNINHEYDMHDLFNHGRWGQTHDETHKEEYYMVSGHVSFDDPDETRYIPDCTEEHIQDEM